MGEEAVLGEKSHDDAILTPAALDFVADLVERFAPGLCAPLQLLARRRERQARFDRGELPDFLPETRAIRDGEWRVAPLPADLLRRVVEITGPVDKKMIINALCSKADVFMADFEDSNAPTWVNVIAGQVNLRDAVQGTIRHVDSATGKIYQLQGPLGIEAARRTATLMVRPRGLHLEEAHVTFDAAPIPACLLDLGLYVFHNARALLDRGSGPYLYLPKLESHLEARWYEQVLAHAERALHLPKGAIKVTVLIETLPAAFEMDEILYELRERAVGLNCGRWDYIFSFIKTFRKHAGMVLPDRGQVGMTQPFMRAYTQLLIKTCHRRGAFAMGGMAAQIPIKSDPTANAEALAKVRADKEREARDGHDGTWVAHPGLVQVARDTFESVLDGRKNQLDVMREDVQVTRDDLLEVPAGTRSDAGLRHNIRVGIQYLEAWLRGAGCVPLYHLMEDAATAEISRAQIWQWLEHGAVTDDGLPITALRVKRSIDDEMSAIQRELGDARYTAGRFAEARTLFEQVATDTSRFTEFLTLSALSYLRAARATPGAHSVGLLGPQGAPTPGDAKGSHSLP